MTLSFASSTISKNQNSPTSSTTKMTGSDSDTNIEPYHEPPFESPTTKGCYYCKICSTYTNDFYPSAVQTADRRCRPCQQQKQRTYRQSLSLIDKLVKKLKYNLIYNKQSKMARACTRTHVIKILSSQGVADPEQLNFVKTISPNFDPISNQWRYKVVFHTGQLASQQRKCIYRN